MNGHSLVAVYESRAHAERARDRLMQLGIPPADIRLSADPGMERMGTERVGMERLEGEHRAGFWDWLFGEDIPERDRHWYDTNLRGGRTALSVLVRNEAERGRVAEVLEEFDPIDFDDGSATPMPRSGMAEHERPMPGGNMAETAAIYPGTTPQPPLAGATPPVSEDRRVSGEQDQVIPVVKEELDVGKRASERRYRIRTYVVERPVEEAVTLRDERVIIEHRPVTGDRAAGNAELPQEREYEVIERHEEPVVEKQARRVEDVVVRKEADQRTETVRDTVRETKVDVDKEGAEREGTLPNRTP
jgi:stress response protein YsnF